MAAMSQAAAAAGRPSATYDIARDIAAIIFKDEAAVDSNVPLATASFTAAAPAFAVV